MKLPLSWLKEWVDIPWPAAGLASRLTLAGFEVEGVEPAAPPFGGVVVAEILATAPHPEADKLRICTVAYGAALPLQIVCGAANARPGLKVALAQVGAVLPGEIAIKAAKLRGVDSAGMLCSARELGLASGSTGLLELPADAPPGASLRDYLLLDDAVLELKIYANRGDAMSVQGVAREIAALTGAAPRVQQTAAVSGTPMDGDTANVVAATAAPRFITRRLRGLNNRAATPQWMQERLRRAGLRSINPIVDVTNYVMLERGQPMHAYDHRRLHGALQVRMAAAGEKLQLLDGRSIDLAPDLLLIADDSGPVGLAGIMGGETTSITDDVTDVLLEVAFFQPAAIAGRARRFGLQTDASQRFERGVDPEGQRAATERATQLLLQLCGGEAGPVREQLHEAALPRRVPVVLRRSRLALLAGSTFADQRVEASLRSLGLKVETDPAGWRVWPASWRFDISIEADLIEEVLRIVGFDAVPEQPRRLTQRFARRSEAHIDERAVLDALVARGYQEAINYAFVESQLQQRLFPQAQPLRLANPIAADQAVMRVSLWPGLLRAAMDNHRRQQDRVRLFERGAVYLRSAAGASHGIDEPLRVAGVTLGSRLPEQWGQQRADADFFDLKADVSAVLELAGSSVMFEYEQASASCLHPGRSAQILRNGRPVGLLGELHPLLAAELDLPAGVALFEIDITPALEAPLAGFAPVSRFPQVRRDLAVTVPESTPLSAVRSRVSVAAGSLLRDLRVFDLYQGPGIESGRKSIALGLIFQDNNKTLKDDEADALMTSVAADLSKTLGARIRD